MINCFLTVSHQTKACLSLVNHFKIFLASQLSQPHNQLSRNPGSLIPNRKRLQTMITGLIARVKYFNKVPENCQWQKLKLHSIPQLCVRNAKDSSFVWCTLDSAGSPVPAWWHIYLSNQQTAAGAQLMPPSANQKHRTNSFDNATRRGRGIPSGYPGSQGRSGFAWDDDAVKDAFKD